MTLSLRTVQEAGQFPNSVGKSGYAPDEDAHIHEVCYRAVELIRGQLTVPERRSEEEYRKLKEYQVEYIEEEQGAESRVSG